MSQEWVRNLLNKERIRLKECFGAMLRQFFLKKLGLKLGIGLLIAFFAQGFSLNSFEGRLYNSYVRLSCALGSCDAEPSIVLVPISPEKIREMADSRALTPQIWLQIAESLGQSGALQVGFVDVNYEYIGNSQDKLRFAEALSKVSSVVFGSKWDEDKKQPSAIDPEFVNKFHSGYEWSVRDIESFAQDGVSRRAFFELNQELSFSARMASFLHPAIESRKANGVFELPNLPGIYQFYFKYAQPNSFKRVDISKILQGKTEALRNKIVLFGFEDPQSLYLTTKTPFPAEDGSFREISLLELKAHEIQTLITDSAMKTGFSVAEKSAAYGFAMITSVIALSVTPISGVLMTTALVILLFAAGFISFAAGFWVLLAPAMLAVVAGYYFALPFRLIGEHKKRWELQQQHSLLLEVEELKSNFMSLVSHDLKTPVARIQSMAELGMDDPSIQNNQRQKQVLQGILKSSHELIQFIGNILSLSRVESGSVQLSLSPVDINELVEKVLIKLGDQAQSKGITIDCNLDPLFPIKIDAALAEQVIYNLVQNAILYSPSGSRVLISSSEQIESGKKDPFVKITVRDNGLGMSADEQKRVFQKFYRGRHPNKVSAKGSGLGLYLVKYFVELHGGRVKLLSKENEGSEFSVYLPTVEVELAQSKKTKKFTKLFKKEAGV